VAATVQIVLGVESAEMQDGLQARIHDPLWLLARQWQFGEFTGEDTGSPAAAQIVVESSPIARYRPGAGASGNAVQPYAPGAVPLETLVEREAVTSERLLGWRGAAEAGLHLARLLRAADLAPVATLLAGSALALAPDAPPARRPDSKSQRLLSIVGARVVDGTRLHATLAPLHARGALAEVFQDVPFDDVAAGHRQTVEGVLAAWMTWYAARFSESAGTPAWVPERLEYEFAIAAHASDGECVLAAPEYLGGHLDWYSFVAAPGASLGAADPVATVATAFLPSPVGYRGMPSPRLWEFEDGSINFARVEASPGDLGRLLLLQFALEYGNDWFLVPLEIDAGSLSRVASLVVTNTFGERLLVPHAGDVDGAASPWRMFTLTGDERRFLFLPPVLGQSLQSAPIEDVLLLRDEMANVAWAVERVVQGASGRAVDRFEAYQERRRLEPDPPVDAAADDAARYELGTAVPDYWIPLLPVQVGSSMHLRRGVLGVDTTAGLPVAHGRILEPGRELLLHDEEVPREGARVSRTYQYARWVDGASHLWVGRRKQPGRGEGSSGLRFDVLTTG